MHRLLCVATLILLAGCSSQHQYFRPTEPVLTESPTGGAAAQYSIGRQDQRWGEVRVWSNGAYWLDDEDGVSRAALHLGFEFENALDEPMLFDAEATQVSSVKTETRTMAPMSPGLVEGVLETAPHSVNQVDLEFFLPEGVSPTDLRGFIVRWTVGGADGWSYERHSRFLYERRNNYRYYYGYYGPYYPWGYGWGWGGPWCY